jgi:hypothetical protein
LVTESVSIVDNVSQCGLPAPPIAKYFLKLVRRKAIDSVAEGLDTQAIEKESDHDQTEAEPQGETDPASDGESR